MPNGESNSMTPTHEIYGIIVWSWMGSLGVVIAVGFIANIIRRLWK